MKRWIIIIWFLLFLFLFGYTGALAQPVVKIGYVANESFAPFFLAEEKGYYKEQGIKVELVKLPSGPDILAQVATGDLQVGGGSMAASAYNAIQGKLPVKYVAVMSLAHSEDYLVVRKLDYDQGKVARMEGLKGKPIGLVTRGSTLEWNLNEMFKKGNFTIKDVDLRIMPFPEMVVALETGAISAASIPEPVATSAEMKGVGIRPWKAPSDVKPPPSTNVFWNTLWAAKNQDMARGLMVTYLKAVRDLSGKDAWRKPENLAIIQKYTKVAPDVLIKARAPSFSPNLEIDMKVLMDQQRLFLERGYLKYETLLPVETMFDLSYADYAVKKLGRW